MKNVSTYNAFRKQIMRMNLIIVLMLRTHRGEAYTTYTFAFLVFSGKRKHIQNLKFP